LELDASESLIIAATNHPQLLDRAIFRRFDAVVEYPLPSRDVVRKVIRNRLATVQVGRLSWVKIDEVAADLSHGEIAAAVELAAKEVILSGSGQVTTASLCAALQERRVQHAG
jgi:AAA+ superfamily predicted ATPase